MKYICCESSTSIRSVYVPVIPYTRCHYCRSILCEISTYHPPVGQYGGSKSDKAVGQYGGSKSDKMSFSPQIKK
jgi:hypothetical protein